MKKYLKKIIRFFLLKFLPKNILTAITWNRGSTAKDFSYWWNFVIVKETIQEWVTGEAKLSWHSLQIRERKTPFGRVLAFGDGYGMAAEAAVKRNDTHEVIYFNLAKGEGDRFKKLFANQNFKFPYRFEFGDANKFEFIKLGKFDTIISVGAFHHFSNFETIFPQLNQIIGEHGLIYLDEFIGPSKWHYKTTIINQINSWLSTLPDNLIKNRKLVKSSEFYKIWKNSLDHSECIRSSALDYWIRECFQIIATKPFGGTLLMPFFLTSKLNPSRLNIDNWHHALNGKIQLQKMVLQEKDWISSGKMDSHYMYYVLSKKVNKLF